METQLSNLERKVKDITKTSESLHANFETDRAKIRQLSGVSKIIQKV